MTTDTLSSQTIHHPVLLQEVMNFLAVQADHVVFDATGGGGGHTKALLSCLDHQGTLLITDQDKRAIDELAESLPKTSARIILRHNNFRDIDTILQEENISFLDRALFDLGWSSGQIHNPEYGMSFMVDAPLNMQLSQNDQSVSAFDIVNHWAENTIADILYVFGDERYSRRIARAIIEKRSVEPIRTTGQLAQIIENAVPKKFTHYRIHPATKSFQALRIIVNDEYEALKEALVKTFALLADEGRIAVISFHSGEDRIVKDYFKSLAKENKAHLLVKKPLTASAEEMQENPRARSAKLRVIEKISS